METKQQNQVRVVDVHMPFTSMVVFLVKAALASIPAIIIVSIVISLIFAAIGALTGGLSGIR